MTRAFETGVKTFLEKNPEVTSFRDFSLISNQEIGDFKEVEEIINGMRRSVSLVRDYLSRNSYKVTPFTISEFAEIVSAKIGDLALLLEVAPQPWPMKACVHFRPGGNGTCKYLKYEAYIEVKSGDDTIFRVRHKTLIGQKAN